MSKFLSIEPVPKVVVFDLGKVLLDFDYGITVRGILAYCRISEGDLQELINQSPLLFQYETGSLSTEQFFAEVQTAAGFRGNLTQFSDLFGDIFEPIQPMIQLHAELRSRGVPTFIFSNTNELAIRHIRQRYSFFQQFDGYILSYEHGAMKPDPKLYEVVERVSRRKGAEILYLDDRPENIEEGTARRWQSVLHRSPDLSRTAVERTGVLGQQPG
jgi:haloacid dehalogenase superfamily, subfamily IA, variant 3 with third motif having DD or ED